MRKFIHAALAAGLALAGSQLSAGDKDAERDNANARASDTATEQVLTVGEDAETVVCRRTKVTGSRVSSKRVCQTKAQWAAELAESRRAVERGQNQRTLEDRQGL